MSLLFLGNEDFTISKGAKGPILCNFIPNYSLILFYSTKCPHCQILIPIFKKLPGTINGCQFGMVNVSSNKKMIDMSKETILPITYVPLIILYVNSKPYMIYKGANDINEIKRFIIEISQKINNKQKFALSQTVRNEQIPQKKSTPFSEGIPLYGSNDSPVSYLLYDDVNGYHPNIAKEAVNYTKYNDNSGYHM
jgi:thiol-disulfide isomerase/thioredoxin